MKNNTKLLLWTPVVLVLFALTFNTKFVSKNSPNAMKERFRISLFKQCFFDAAFAACEYEPSELITDSTSSMYGHRIIKTEECINLEQQSKRLWDEKNALLKEHISELMDAPISELHQQQKKLEKLSIEWVSIDKIYGSKCFK